MTQTVNLVILGASGDLTHRLLLPGLGTLLKAEHSLSVHVVGAGAEDWDQDTWRDMVKAALTDGGCSSTAVQAILEDTHYTKIDASSSEDLAGLIKDLTGRIVLYFALPPAVSMAACKALSEISLPPELFLAIEKPFGTDAKSAHDFNELLAHLPLPESHIFRVDHYLGKATVLNLVGLRFTNRLFEPVWNATNIENIQIVYDEALALEGRAGYYDRAGALKDMIQSHLLLVMALLCMEELATFDAFELRDLMAHLLRSTHLWGDDPVKASRRARYTAGKVGDEVVPDYVKEKGVEPSRNTETLAEVVVEVRNARWAGVPITLRSGKALGDGVRQITVVFRPIAHTPTGFHDEAPRNVVVIGLSPEFIRVQLSTNVEGDRFSLEPSVLDAELGVSEIRPYGEILSHILDGDPLLSVRGDVAEECWRIVTPVLEAWAEGKVPLDSYAAGSAGPGAWS
ncbi:MAG TPA: glucose-6-phosphate dehydrogenase [Propionibacteriaceae bacterium]|nr:glucose-6-phosphate dehydrogenase [Propionibacteriaceae bacterium]